MKSASLHSFTLSDQPLGLRRRNKVFQIKYYPMLDNIITQVENFLKTRGDWRLFVLWDEDLVPHRAGQ